MIMMRCIIIILIIFVSVPLWGNNSCDNNAVTLSKLRNTLRYVDFELSDSVSQTIFSSETVSQGMLARIEISDTVFVLYEYTEIPDNKINVQLYILNISIHKGYAQKDGERITFVISKSNNEAASSRESIIEDLRFTPLGVLHPIFMGCYYTLTVWAEYLVRDELPPTFIVDALYKTRDTHCLLVRIRKSKSGDVIYERFKLR